MMVEPLVSASFPIAEHAFVALATLLIGAIQLILAHKVLGYAYNLFSGSGGNGFAYIAIGQNNARKIMHEVVFGA